MSKPSRIIRVLFAVQHKDGVYRCPQQNHPPIGWNIETQDSSHKEAIVRKIRDVVPQADLTRLEIYGPLSPGVFVDELHLPFYLVQSSEVLDVDGEPTLPVLLGSLPADRNRLPYLKSMQILSGALEQSVEAVKIDEAFIELLKSSQSVH